MERLERTLNEYQNITLIVNCTSIILAVILLSVLFFLLYQYNRCYRDKDCFRNAVIRLRESPSLANDDIIKVGYEKIFKELGRKDEKIVFFSGRFLNIYSKIEKDIIFTLKSDSKNIRKVEKEYLEKTLMLIHSFSENRINTSKRNEKLSEVFTIISFILLLINCYLIHYNNYFTIYNSKMSWENSRASKDNTSANQKNTDATKLSTWYTHFNSRVSMSNTRADWNSTVASWNNTEASEENTIASYMNTKASWKNTEASDSNTVANRRNTKATLAGTIATDSNTIASRMNTEASVKNTENIHENSESVLKSTKPGYTYLNEYLKDSVIPDIKILINSLYVLPILEEQASPLKDTILAHLINRYPDLEFADSWRSYCKSDVLQLEGLISMSGFYSNFNLKWEKKELDDTTFYIDYIINKLRQSNDKHYQFQEKIKSKDMSIYLDSIHFLDDSIKYNTFNYFKYKIYNLK